MRMGTRRERISPSRVPSGTMLSCEANEIPFEKTRLAMALPRERPRYNLASIQRRHFEMLGKRLGLGTATGRHIDAALQALPGVIEKVQKDLPRSFPEPLLDRVLGGMGRMARVLATPT